ncbi:MAG TPA: PilN domain-containing protein [Moraxellaceae bacterium]|nr:PilN domain-containing protein [Moraxellaceae bacterium]
MAKINLLPWRQELRKQRQQEFIAILMGVVFVAVAIVLAGHMALSKQVSDQEERNAYIKSEISKLDGQIKEIDELQKRREELLSRMKVIQDLQGRRPVIVRIFDEFVRVIPDGVFFVSLQRVNDSFKITGVAESANQVSALMRNLEASPWFRNPQLSTVAATASPTARTEEEKTAGSKFALTVDLEQPDINAVDGKQGAEKK